MDHTADVREEIERVEGAGGNVSLGFLADPKDGDAELKVTRGLGNFKLEPGFTPHPHVSEAIDLTDASSEFVVLASGVCFCACVRACASAVVRARKHLSAPTRVLQFQRLIMSVLKVLLSCNGRPTRVGLGQSSLARSLMLSFPRHGPKDLTYLSHSPLLPLLPDGLWDVISDEEVISLSRNKLLTGWSPQLVSQFLAETAHQRHSTDDTSVMIYCIAPKFAEAAAVSVGREEGGANRSASVAGVGGVGGGYANSGMQFVSPTQIRQCFNLGTSPAHEVCLHVCLCVCLHVCAYVRVCVQIHSCALKMILVISHPHHPSPYPSLHPVFVTPAMIKSPPPLSLICAADSTSNDAPEKSSKKEALGNE